MSIRLRNWWQRLQQVVTQYFYHFVVLTVALAGVLIAAVLQGWGWGVVAALLFALAGLAGNLLASLIDRWRHPSVSLHEAQGRYLQGLINHCQLLPLAALGSDGGLERGPTLDQVYTDLDTTTRVPHDPAAASRSQHERLADAERYPETVPLTAVQALEQTSHLVLLGAPGSGKSTFVRQMVTKQARALRDPTLPPPAGLARDLLPVLITLRDLAPRLTHLATSGLDTMPIYDRQQALATAVREQAEADLSRWEAREFVSGLREALTTGRCFLVLDGFDEVPQNTRRLVREAVGAVLAVYRAQPVVVTCRVRSYEGEAVLPDFQAHTLADFDNEKIEAFAHAWYKAQKELRHIDALQVEPRAADLVRAATELPANLAANPLLLTTIAIIHQRDTQLPRERVVLYHRAVEVLLRRWHQSKVGEAGLTSDPRLALVLTNDRKLREIVEVLAYRLHAEQQEGGAESGLPRGDALVLLEQDDYLGHVDPANAFLNYIDHSSGLLMGQGGALDKPGTYNFPHRTFQEYLAGCYLMGQRNRDELLEQHARAGTGDAWRSVVLFEAEELLYNRRHQNSLLDLAYDLCRTAAPTTVWEQRLALWSGLMAGLVGRNNIVRDVGRRSGLDYLEQRLLPSLVRLLGSDLTAAERADAGNILAALGDPRFRAEAWSLPNEELLGFVAIPAGAFRMGSDRDDAEAFDFERDAHDVELPLYYMARYPVTVAQFQAFADDKEHNESYVWTSKERQGPSNHPVVWVSWYDAMQYCHWLTARLRAWKGTPAPLKQLLCEAGWQVTLPSEAEWEKAARGTDGWRYPWGEQSDPNLANYYDTGIETTSAVGCFPGGASPYKIQDMSGNVWEWTRSLWGTDENEPTFRYPYTPGDGRENLQANEDVRRVLRGGAFFSDAKLARCAFRGRVDPRNVYDGYVGFRLVLAARP